MVSFPGLGLRGYGLEICLCAGLSVGAPGTSQRSSCCKAMSMIRPRCRRFETLVSLHRPPGMRQADSRQRYKLESRKIQLLLGSLRSGGGSQGMKIRRRRRKRRRRRRWRRRRRRQGTHLRARSHREQHARKHFLIAPQAQRVARRSPSS